MSSGFGLRRIIVIEAAERDAMNALALDFDPVGGEQTFTVGLSASGTGSPTHYVCNATFRETTWGAIEEELVPLYPEVLVYDGSAMGLGDVLSELGLARMEEEE